eukprot:1777084-Heterocapsa_arctica.AAC.1
MTFHVTTYAVFLGEQSAAPWTTKSLNKTFAVVLLLLAHAKSSSIGKRELAFRARKVNSRRGGQERGRRKGALSSVGGTLSNAISPIAPSARAISQSRPALVAGGE